MQQVLARQRELLEKEFQESVEQVDKNFKLMAQEIVARQDQEIAAEKQKWELFQREEERKLRAESERQVDAQLGLFREQLRQEEERERLALQREAEAQLRRLEQELDAKLEREQAALVESYARIRRAVEETEKERFDFELEKFRKEQGRALDTRKGDIERLKAEKRKVQAEYQDLVDKLRRDMEKRLEREKMLIAEQARGELAQIEQDEEAKYERRLAQLKKEPPAQEAETIQAYKQELAEEFELQVRELKQQLEQQLVAEEERLEKKRQRELREYELQLEEQHELELKRKQAKAALVKEQEQRDFELAKLKVDQMMQDQLEAFRRQLQQKLDKERLVRDEERRRRVLDVQASIDKLSLASGDKERLRREVEGLHREQRELEARAKLLEDELEEARTKRRQLERETTELSIQLTSKKAAGDDSQRVQQLRAELAQKTLEVQAAQRQYQGLLEASGGDEDAESGRQVGRLEEEMKQIKAMIEGLQKPRVGHLLEALEEGADGDKENSDGGNQERHLREAVAREKAALKEAERRIAEDKARYIEDKRANDAVRETDPGLYRQRARLLVQVKERIEGKIDQINARIAKVKDMEAQLH